MTPSYIVIECKIKQKIQYKCYKWVNFMLLNTKKICVKQITQIFFKLLFIYGFCL